MTICRAPSDQFLPPAAAVPAAPADPDDAQRALTRRLVAATDRVRREIERDLHDGAQQRLVALAVELRQGDEVDVLAAADEVDTIIAEIRRIARGAHPVMLSEGGLPAALRGLARRSRVPVRLHLPPAPTTAGTTSDVALYYVVSETLTNVVKHANAGHAAVVVEFGERDVAVTVTDDGRGGARVAAGTGLQGLGDRVEALGGTFVLCSPGGGGTAVTVTLPREM